MERNDFSITDAEFLYMVRQNSLDSLDLISGYFHRLIWARSHDFYNSQNPDGIQMEDFFQEGYVSFKESLYSFREEKQVGLAFYINLCVSSGIKTALRRCRSGSYSLLNSKYSLDVGIAEGANLSFIDTMASSRYSDDPSKMAIYNETMLISDAYINQLKIYEQQIHRLHIQGYSYKDIAQRLEVGTKDVDNTVQKIRRNLRDKLAH